MLSLTETNPFDVGCTLNVGLSLPNCDTSGSRVKTWDKNKIRRPDTCAAGRHFDEDNPQCTGIRNMWRTNWHQAQIYSQTPQEKKMLRWTTVGLFHNRQLSCFTGRRSTGGVITLTMALLNYYFPVSLNKWLMWLHAQNERGSQPAIIHFIVYCLPVFSLPLQNNVLYEQRLLTLPVLSG